MIIDCSDDVTKANQLTSKPFSLVYKIPQRGAPRLIPKYNANNAVLTNYVMLKKLRTPENYSLRRRYQNQPKIMA